MTVTPPATSATFTATLASATLGPPCAVATPSTSPTASATPPPPTAGDVSHDVSDSSTRTGGTAKRAPRCVESEMQLQLQLIGAPAARVRIARVEASSEDKLLGDLTANQPTTWSSSAGQYTTWDGSLTAGEPTMVSFKLSTASLPAGANLNASSYELAVTVEAVLPDGTVLRAADTYLFGIAAEPHMVT